jgi:hypothetical protein
MAPPKSWESPTLAILGLPLGSLGTKSHLDVGIVGSHKVYYKGEGGGFPQVRAVVRFVSPSCLWFILAPKVLQLCTNHFVLVLCKPMWVNKTCCQFFLVPSWNSNTPFYPSKVLRARECAPTPCSSVVFYLGLTFESLKELGACHLLCGFLISSLWEFSSSLACSQLFYVHIWLFFMLLYSPLLQNLCVFF